MNWESEYLEPSSACTWGTVVGLQFWPRPSDFLGISLLTSKMKGLNQMRMKNKALFQLDKSVILDSVFVWEKWDLLTVLLSMQ